MQTQGKRQKTKYLCGNYDPSITYRDCDTQGFTELWAGIIVDPATATQAALSMRTPDTFLVSFFPDDAFQV